MHAFKNFPRVFFVAAVVACRAKASTELTEEACAQDAFCKMEGFAYAGWSVLVLCYILGLGGMTYLWIRRPSQTSAIGKRLPSLSESLIENDHSPDVSMKIKSSSSDGRSSSIDNTEKVDDDKTGKEVSYEVEDKNSETVDV